MKNGFAIVLCLVISAFTSAQEPKNAKITVHDPFQNIQTIDPEKDVAGESMAYKWNYTMIGRGAMILNVEKMLGEQLSAEVGLGVTYRDFIYELFNDFDGGLFDEDGVEIKVKPGLGLSGSMRYYPVDGDLEGFYIAPTVRYRTYNLTRDVWDDASNDYIPLKDDYNITEYCFLVGWQGEDFNGLLWDTYFGVSYNNINYHRIETEGVPLSEKAVRQRPGIIIGMKLGFAK